MSCQATAAPMTAIARNRGHPGEAWNESGKNWIL
jgi:hypothetical protein